MARRLLNSRGTRGDRPRRECGFTYIGLLMLLAVIGIAATASVQLGSVVQRRHAEQELLFLGSQFRAALSSYANGSAPNQPRFPRTFEQLLRDPRVPGVRRHLRRVPIDPLTGKDEWGIVRSADGYIVGIFSLSEASPIKRGNFNAEFAEFAAATSYRNWVFKAAPQSGVAQRPAPGAPPAKK